ncbi:MAG: TIM barrel protein [Chloroflexi bacterium]|nr:TIM barrel protein [Chloroflexota bacterium]
MRDIKIGFSMHPRWVTGTGLGNFIAPLRCAGLSALEFELDDHLDLWAEFGPLMEEAAGIGMELSFHAPYRPPHSLEGFSGQRRGEIVLDYRPLLDIAADWARRAGGPKTVVIHAAAAQSPAGRDALFADTVAFLEWALETYPNLLFALENNHPATRNQIKVGVEREDVLKIITELHHPQLRVCWDMGHDYLNGSGKKPEPAWLSQVVHVHLHDVDTAGTDHYPLVYGNVPYQAWLQAIKQVWMKGIVVLELKGHQLKDWQPERIPMALADSIRAIAMELE